MSDKNLPANRDIRRRDPDKEGILNIRIGDLEQYRRCYIFCVYCSEDRNDRALNPNAVDLRLSNSQEIS